VLLGQQKYAEAERLLVDGYVGLKQRAGQLPPGAKPYLPEAGDRLVQFYDAWGEPDQAEDWRKKLAADRAARSADPKKD
jgi:eukaryotic-like serine/threonine-protein kinase